MHSCPSNHESVTSQLSIIVRIYDQARPAPSESCLDLKSRALFWGAIPVAIEALKAGSQGIAILQRSSRYENELKRLINRLENERVRLEDVCEKVLVDLVSHSRIEELVQNPDRLFNDDPELKAKLRKRLWKGFNLFDQTLQDINVAMNEAINRISLQVQDESNIRRSLKHSFLDDLLSRIDEGVSVLEQLVDRSIQLEPARNMRFQGRFLLFIRKLACQLSCALQASFHCTCGHQICLQLERRSPDMVPGDTGDDAVKYIGFHLALSYKGPSKNPDIISSRDTMWSDVFAKPSPIARPEALTISIQPKLKDHLKASKGNNSPIYRRYLSSPMNGSAKLQADSVELKSVVNHPQRSTRTVDLCNTITQPLEPGTKTSYGMIFDASTPETYTYHVSSVILSKYRAQCGRSITSLNEVLGQNRRYMILSEQDRLKLAAVVSSNLLQLHGSSWMPKVIRSQDIYLIQSEDDPICDRFFVMQTLPNKADSCIEENTKLSSMRNQTLFYLGVLLIELAFGKSFELLRSERDRSSTGSQFFTEYRTAKRLVDQVKSFIGPNYGSAVSRCIDGEFHGRGVGLEDQDLSHDVYAGVVALLEKELEG
ncbi:hypothetical protein FVEG_07773 [Fusarium verticillioides 7600]|uniref:DUF7580 domain-containing protein n=1 Tax=Gibberella moniliformis (strain M3125 / FGSC 7600) TaxID=334819 RepID=W7M9P6_GIBM7|nr:hypothetical protein FVEG_07773 [Fusarium verticillioides 7600]EWG47726.1 hypothetical protein FVEG_07773 [Fusarium verticillioides 7600]